MIKGWNLLNDDRATENTLRTLRQSVGGKGSWDGKLVLSKKALQIFRPGFTHKAVWGGRVTAKTTTIALYIIMRMDAAYTVVVGLRKRQVSIRHTNKHALERAIRWLGLQDRFDVVQNEIRNKVTGSYAFFRGLEHDSDEATRGLDGVDIFWLDEARNVAHNDLMNLIRVIRERGAELINSWNPLDPDDPVEALYRTGKVLPQNLLTVHMTQEDNPAFFASPACDEYWRLKASDEQTWRHVYGGEYDTLASDRIYPKAEIGIVPGHYLEGLKPCYGLDLGYVNDPTVVTKSWVIEKYKTIYIERESVGYGEDEDGIADLLDYVLHDKSAPVISDNSEQRTTSALNGRGYNIVVTQKNVVGKSVVEGIRFINGFRQVIHPNCTETQTEAKHYRWKIDRSTGGPTSTPRKGHDHCWDSIRYAIMGRTVDSEVLVFRIPGF